MAKITLEMEVSNNDIEDALVSLKELAAVTTRINDLCDDMSFLTKAVANSNKEVKKLNTAVQKLLEQSNHGSDT